jgi:hypothetical protein
LGLLVVLIGQYAPSTDAYTVDRRRLVQSALATAAAAVGAAPPSLAVLSSKYCASGVGEGCTDLSEGNDFIRALQEKSAANRERNEKASRASSRSGCVSA